MLPYFHERQKMPWIISVAVLSGSVAFAGVILFLWFGSETEPSMIRLLWGVWLVVTLIDGLLATFKLVTEVHSDGVKVWFGPFHFPSKHIQWQEVETIYPRVYSPIAEYGGWGIRYGKAGGAYNIRGSQGVQLILKNGKKFLIGTQQPDDFIQAVKAAGGPVGEESDGV